MLSIWRNRKEEQYGTQAVLPQTLSGKEMSMRKSKTNKETKHNVLIHKIKECLILSPKFKFVDEDLVILRAPRKNDVYSLDLKNIIPLVGIHSWKELYDKVSSNLLKTHFKDFIPMDSEKEREMLKERDAKRLLRKRKATIAEEQPSKKPKLRTETIDEA
ncbi:hypothetical protein Tco_0415614 [Tanacetum coccineum]